MPTLRITQNGPQVEAKFEGDGLPPLSVKRPFSFTLSAQDAEDIRWYLEDYMVYPLDPAPKIAKRIEQRIRDIGVELFRAILAGSDVWALAKQHLSETRIEIESDVQDAVAPWELLRDPESDLPLALHVPSFVRGRTQAAMRPKAVEAEATKVRILLAICRPDGADDLPFRSVARHLLKGLTQGAREPFVLEVLRPPTFEQIGQAAPHGQSQGRAVPRGSLRWTRNQRSGLVRKRAIDKGSRTREAAERDRRPRLDSERLPFRSRRAASAS